MSSGSKDDSFNKGTVLSVFGVDPRRIGGTEMFARELSRQLGVLEFQSVLCFLSDPTEEVRRFIDLPNVSFTTLAGSTDGGRTARTNLRQLLGTYSPEILHLHYVSFLSLYPWTARMRAVEKVFFTDHHSRPEGHIARRAPAWKRVMGRCMGLPLNKVISVSHYGYECLTTTDVLPRERFQLIYNGVDLERVSKAVDAGAAFRHRFKIPEDRTLIVQVSWIIPEKGIADFLEMARIVAEQRPHAHFVLAGDGDYREQYMCAAEKMGLSDRITWTGIIDDPFSSGIFHAADVVCQFSRWEEVFGWMIAEAMGHGKPVVATRVGGIPEVIADGKSGYLVPRGDTGAMSRRVLELLDQPDRRAQMGAAGLDIVQSRFNLRKNVGQLIETYGIGGRRELEPGPQSFPEMGNSAEFHLYKPRRAPVRPAA